MFNYRTNISFDWFKLSVLSIDIYFERSQEIIITSINNDKILTEFNKEIKYFWTESIIRFIKYINMIVYQKIKKQ